MMEFDEYLKKKRIDPEKFQKDKPKDYVALKHFFNQVHPNNFTQQKLFLINKIRRAYRLEEKEEIAQKKESKATMS